MDKVEEAIKLLEQLMDELLEIGTSLRKDAPQLFEQKIESWQRRTSRIVSTYLKPQVLERFHIQCKKVDWSTPGYFIQDSVEKINMLASLIKNLISDLEKHPEDVIDLDATQERKKEVSSEAVIDEGQYYDVLKIVIDICAQAQKSITIIDRYVFDDILSLLPRDKEKLTIKILTKEISNKFKVLGTAFQKQHKNLSIRKADVFHARFIIIDEKKYYQLDSSIDKHLGKRITTYRHIQKPQSIEKIDQVFEKNWNKADIIVGSNP